MCPGCQRESILPVLFGMPTEDPGPEWIVDGCPPQEHMDRYGCPSCGWRGPLTEVTTDGVVHLTEDLFRLTDTKSLAELSGVVGEEIEYDAWLELLKEGEPPGVEIRILDRGLGLEFPFTRREFWAAVISFEDEVCKDLRAEQEQDL